MSYFRKSRSLGATETVNLNFPSSSATIAMDDDFVGNLNALPICPKTDQNGWCRRYVGGSAIKSAINYTGPAAATTTAASSAVSNAFSSILTALTSPAKLPTVTPTAAAASAGGGMSTTTKVALAGGAVLLVAILARR